MTDSALQRYQIMEPLGAGSQGQTFRAIDRETNTPVAVKILHLGSLGGDWKPFDLFERECAALESLAHPGIPRYLNRFSSESSGDFFLVMELIDGAPLSKRLGRPLDPKDLLDWLRQCLEILSYLHSRSPAVIHRDIKPSNLMLGPDGRIRLIDFGGVRLALRPDGGSTMIGTYGYMAPEQLHGEATAATDIYALGATITALAAGLPAEQLPRSGLRIDVDAALPPGPRREVLRAMVEPDPDDRLSNAAAVRRMLDGAALGGAIPSPAKARKRAAKASREVAIQEDGADFEGLRDLPGFIRFFVWIAAWAATSLTLAVEFVGVPAVFALMGATRRYRKERRKRRLKAREAEALAEVHSARLKIQALVAQVDPWNEPKALPPGDDDT